MYTTPTRRFEGSLEPREIEPGLFSFPRAQDGVYEYFAGQPLCVVFNDVPYNLIAVPGVKMSATTAVTDEAMRICRILQAAFNPAASPVDNVNDGIYRETKDGAPAYAVIDGKTYKLGLRI